MLTPVMRAGDREAREAIVGTETARGEGTGGATFGCWATWEVVQWDVVVQWDESVVFVMSPSRLG